MNAGKTASWWRGQIPSLVLVLVLAALAAWALVTGAGAAQDVPQIDPPRGLLLVVVGSPAGLGGGYALVPGLMYLFGAPVYITMGSSLATMIPSAAVGGGIKIAQGFVDLATGSLLGAGVVIGAQVGAAIIKRFQPATLKLIFGLYFLYVAVSPSPASLASPSGRGRRQTKQVETQDPERPDGAAGHGAAGGNRCRPTTRHTIAIWTSA